MNQPPIQTICTLSLRSHPHDSGRVQCSDSWMLGDTDAQGFVHSEAQMPRLGDLDALEIWRLRDSETRTLGSLDSGAQMLGCSQTLRHLEAQTWILGGSEAQRLRCTGAQTQTYRLRDLEDWKIGGSEAQRLRPRHSDLDARRLGCLTLGNSDSEAQKLRCSEAWRLGCSGAQTQTHRLGDSEHRRLRDLEDQRLRDLGAQRLGGSEAWKLGGSEAQKLRSSDVQTQRLRYSEAWRLRLSDTQCSDSDTQNFGSSDSCKLRCSVVDHMMRCLTVSDKFEVLFHDQNKHKILNERDRCDTKT
jgi:hypothetical protein